LKILLVEDDLTIADAVIQQLQDIGYKNVIKANNSEKAIEVFKNEEVDFLILDIGLKNSKTDGIDLAKEITNIKTTPIIFLSSYSDKRTLDRVKEVEHANYLVKPCSTRQMFVSIDSTIDRFTINPLESTLKNPRCPFNQEADHFFLKGKDKAYHKIYIYNILWIEAVRGGIEINLSDGKKEILTASMQSFLLQFQHANLVRVHRSFIINQTKVSSILDKSFTIKTTRISKVIPCSSAYWTKVKSLFKTLKSD